MKLLHDEIAISTVWITMLIALFGFSLIYTLMYDILCVQIMNLMITLSPIGTPQAFFDNIDRFRLMFKALPFIAFFGIIMWAYVRSQKQEYT
jgi:hypothetical protein